MTFGRRCACSGPSTSATTGIGSTSPVSHPRRCPTWDEMCMVKRRFWGPDVECVQFHPREDDYVNLHPYSLHIWRPADGELRFPGFWRTRR